MKKDGLRLGTVLLAASVFFASPTCLPAKSTEMTASYEEWFEMLDSNSCQRRTAAWTFLCNEANFPEKQSALLVAVRQSLLQRKTSFEVQSSLEKLEDILLEQMGSAEVEAAKKKVQNIPVGEDALRPECWGMLTSEVCSERNLAERQLKERLRNPKECGKILQILRNMLISQPMSPDDLQRVHGLEQLARFEWLQMPENEREIPAFSESQMQEWVDFLAAANLPEDVLVPWMNLDERVTVQFSIRPGAELAGGDGFGFLIHGTSRFEQEKGLQIWKTVRIIEDALVCEKTYVQTSRMVQEKLASKKVTPSGTILLKRLAFLSKPCLAAEYWFGGELRTAQILQVGVPQNCGQNLCTCFDSLSEHSAHCSTGTNLAPGEYPLQDVILHPKQSEAFFYFVPLDTPRKKLLYASQTGAPQLERWKKISADSLSRLNQRCVQEKRGLTEEEIQILPLLEPEEVSRQAGDWLVSWPPEEEKKRNEMPVGYEMLPKKKTFEGRAALCMVLCTVGTKEAMDGLIQIIKDEGLRGQKTFVSGVQIAYAAAFSILMRDLSCNEDAWLISLLEKNDALFEKDSVLDDSPMQMVKRVSNLQISVVNESANSEPDEWMPTVSATAAGILLARKEFPDFSGLQSVPTPMGFPANTQLTFYRYKDAAARQKYRKMFSNLNLKNE